MAHLTKEDRLRIKNMLNAGVSATEMSRKLGKSHTTISREIKKINNLQQTENYVILCFSVAKCRYPLNSPFVWCRGHEDFGLHKAIENNDL